MLVWRENTKKWTGPFPLRSINGETCTVDNGKLTNFRTTIVKPFRTDPDEITDEITSDQQIPNDPPDETPRPSSPQIQVVIRNPPSTPEIP